MLTIREVASAIGTFVAALPAVPHGTLHHRSIEKAKNSALLSAKGNFNRKMALPMDALSDIFWWEQHVLVSFSPIRRDAVHYTLYYDASLEGWGGTDITTHIGGRWTDAKMPHHINALELQAAYLTLQALGSEYRNVHIRLMLDNTTATTYIKKMGAHTQPLVILLPKQFGVGLFPGMSGYRLPLSLVHKTTDFKSRNFNNNRVELVPHFV